MSLDTASQFSAPKVRRGRLRMGPRGLIMPGIPLAFLVIVVLAAIAAPLIAPHDPVVSNLGDALRPPAWLPGGSIDHLLGTDRFGRDILSRLIFGARVSLGVAALTIAIATVVGTTVGLVAGYFGGWVGSILMRLVDMVLTLPMILIALALAVAAGPSFSNLVLVVGFLLWPRIARLVRGEAMLIKEQEFVRYARVAGVPAVVIIVRHILPNVVPTILVATTLEVAHVILVEASLSFLGAGVPAPEPSWGVMISDGRALIATGWWIALFPGLAIMATVIVFNVIGDWLRDRLDPKLKAF